MYGSKACKLSKELKFKASQGDRTDSFFPSDPKAPVPDNETVSTSPADKMSLKREFSIADIIDRDGFLKHKDIQNFDQGVEVIGKKVTVLTYIQSGAAGSVFKVRDQASGKLFAAKVYFAAGRAEQEFQNYFETARLRSDHPDRKRIVRLHALSTLVPKEEDTLGFLYPIRIGFFTFCDGGDLCDGLLDRYVLRKQHIPEAFLWHVLLQLLQAVAFLSDPLVVHEATDQASCSPQDNDDEKGGLTSVPVVLHADLKPDNVFLKWQDEDHIGYPDVILGDFGLAFELPPGQNKVYRKIGLPAWSAPEHPNLSAKGELWSVGAMIHALAHRGVPPIDFGCRDNWLDPFNPLASTRASDFYKSFLPKKVRPLPDCYSAELNMIVLKMLTKNARKRPSAQEMRSLVCELAPMKIASLYVDLPWWACNKGPTPWPVKT